MNAQNVYQKALGKAPHDHQQKAWEALQQGKSVVLRAPTGSGKTEAVFLPFCTAAGEQLPSRLIYALPLRALANQITDRLQNHAKKLGKTNWRIRLQHGQRPESVLFAADVVVATIDQIVTSFACSPLILPLRHGNIPAGAVMSSFIAFDEVHLFDPLLALQATRLICERLHRLGLPFALLSATLPDWVLDFWKEKFGCEVIDAQSEPINRTAEMAFCNQPLEVANILDAMKQGYQRILVVTNTVERAIGLFQQVQDSAKQQGYECELLHARFLPGDRQTKEKWVVERFGRNGEGEKSLLVATQVVEAGLDISADCVLTELAPIDAIIQRAGRCARWGGNGTVRIFAVDNSAPYDKDLVSKTGEVFQRDLPETLSWKQAKDWVNRVLNKHYQKVLEDREEVYEQVVAGLSYAAFIGDRKKAEAAVRDAQTVEVALHSNPQNLGNDVLRLPTISVYIGVAKRWLKEKAKAWRVEVDRNVSDAQVQVRCEPLSEQSEICLGDRIAFAPTHLVYDHELGLRLEKDKTSNDFQPLPTKERVPPKVTLRKEAWIDHAVETVSWIETLLCRDKHAVEGLARMLGIQPEEVKRAARLAALLHDFGKLTVEWQEKSGVTARASADQLLAHTSERNYIHFPPHATVSAFALWDLLTQSGLLPRKLGRAVALAIAHHHSVRAQQVPSYTKLLAW